MPRDDRAVREQVARVEVLLAELEAQAEPRLRETLEEALAALLALYGEGLVRVLDHVDRAGAGAVRRALARDEWVGQLLLLHGLHPDACEERVARALDEVRPALHAHGGDVDLLGVSDAVVRLRLRGTCDGCAASAATLRDTVESAVRAAAPEVERIETEGLAEPAGTVIPLESLGVTLDGPPGGGGAGR